MCDVGVAPLYSAVAKVLPIARSHHLWAITNAGEGGWLLPISHFECRGVCTTASTGL
jgi:hypothetical protein